jgi:hypothetical protein
LFLKCKNWRLNLIKTSNDITFIPYFEDKDACKKANEKIEAHKRAKQEQKDIQSAENLAAKDESALMKPKR